MEKILFLIQGIASVCKYIGEDIFLRTNRGAANALKIANLYVESPYHTYESVICLQRAQRN